MKPVAVQSMYKLDSKSVKSKNKLIGRSFFAASTEGVVKIINYC